MPYNLLRFHSIHRNSYVQVRALMLVSRVLLANVPLMACCVILAHLIERIIH